MTLLGTKIRELRKQAGLKQGELAAKLGTTQARISRIESGKDRLYTEKQIGPFAKALNCKLSTLMELQKEDSDGRIYMEVGDQGLLASVDLDAGLLGSSTKTEKGDQYVKILVSDDQLSRVALEFYKTAPKEIREKINYQILSISQSYLANKAQEDDSSEGEE